MMFGPSTTNAFLIVAVAYGSLKLTAGHVQLFELYWLLITSFRNAMDLVEHFYRLSCLAAMLLRPLLQPLILFILLLLQTLLLPFLFLSLLFQFGLLPFDSLFNNVFPSR